VVGLEEKCSRRGPRLDLAAVLGQVEERVVDGVGGRVRFNEAELGQGQRQAGGAGVGDGPVATEGGVVEGDGLPIATAGELKGEGFSTSRQPALDTSRLKSSRGLSGETVRVWTPAAVTVKGSRPMRVGAALE
jgi:hypothetical protein